MSLLIAAERSNRPIHTVIWKRIQVQASVIKELKSNVNKMILPVLEDPVTFTDLWLSQLRTDSRPAEGKLSKLLSKCGASKAKQANDKMVINFAEIRKSSGNLGQG